MLPISNYCLLYQNAKPFVNQIEYFWFIKSGLLEDLSNFGKKTRRALILTEFDKSRRTAKKHQIFTERTRFDNLTEWNLQMKGFVHFSFVLAFPLCYYNQKGVPFPHGFESRRNFFVVNNDPPFLTRYFGKFSFDYFRTTDYL